MKEDRPEIETGTLISFSRAIFVVQTAYTKVGIISAKIESMYPFRKPLCQTFSSSPRLASHIEINQPDNLKELAAS